MESKTRGRELGRYASSKRNGSSIPRPRGASHYGVKINTFIPASYVVDSLSLCPTAAANGDGCGELYAFHNLFLVAIPS